MVIWTGVTATATAILNALVPVLFAASFTCTVNDTVPAVVGVPEITPVDAARLKPAGSDPALTLQLYGVVPPLACSVVEYAVPAVPPGSDTVVTVGGWAAAATAILNAFVPVLFAASFTCTVNDTVPAVVGVPEITPVDAARLKPAGSDPALTLQLYGAVPPLACSVVEYAVPAVPPGSDTVVTVGGWAAAATAILNAFVPVPFAASFTCTVNDTVPAVVGVPEITPVDAARLKPAGSDPALTLQLYGAVPPLACSVVEYAVPAVPPGSDTVVTVGGWAAAATAILNAFVPLLFAASVTCTVNDTVPAVVGVPEITPVDAARLKPAGSDPALTLQLYGAVPPLACSVVEYAVPAVPPGSDTVVTVGGWAAAATAILNAFVPVPFAASFTCTVNDTVPAVVGVPEITPVDGTRLKPAGSDPALTLQLYGAVPPLACSVVEYAVPAVPPGSDTVVTVGGWAAAATAILNAFVPLLFAASVTCTVNDTVPAVVGVPEITPVDAARLKPAGSDPALTLQLYGAVPPLACSVVEYAVPAVPPGSDTVVTVGGWAAAATAILNAFVPLLFAASVTCTVNDTVPAVVGVPEITPVDAARLKPAGSDPALTLQLYGAVPPLACSVVEYAVPVVPPGSDVVVTNGGWAVAATTILSAFVAGLFAASFTCTVNDAVPNVVGVPLICPVELFSVRPAGKEPEVIVQVYGVVPPLACSVVEYAVPVVPPGSDTVVTVGGWAAAATAILNAFVPLLFAASVTCTVNDTVPAVVGVPEITPVDAARLKPAGSDPALTLQLYGAVPPLACSVVEYAVPAVPPGSDTVVTVGGWAAAATAILNAFVPLLFAASVTCTVNDTVPAVVGVPEITPVDAARLKPAGSDPALTLQLYGAVPPLACSVVEYAVPAVPPGSDTVVTVGGWAAAATAILNAFVPLLFAASVTCTVNDTVPAVVGVPEITPVDAAKLKPAGSDPALTLQLYGAVPPLACSVVEYAVPAVPPGSDTVVTVGGWAAAATAILNAFVPLLFAASVTCTVNDTVPAVAGVPEITPVDAAKLKPAGSDPALTLQLYGAVPPLACSVVEYAVPVVPPGSDTVVTVGGWAAAATAILNAFVPLLFAASVTCTVNDTVPAVVGVPEITPVDAAKLKPAGSDPALTLQLYGAVPPLACSVVEYAVPVVPPGSDTVVTVGGWAAAATAILNAFVPLLFAASVTCTVNDTVPAVVGVPEITPVDAAKLKPAGSDPALTLQLYGAVPPLACSVVEYAVPVVPPGSDTVVTVGGWAAAATAILNAFVPLLFAASVTCTVNDTVPAVVGVPEITPVDAARLKPAGSDPALTLQLYGAVPPLACSVVEYAVPVVPPGSDTVVTVGGWAAAATAILNAFVPLLFAASVTCTVNDTVPAVVGVPEITPVDAAKLKPAGSDPALTLQLYGAVPPLACSVAEYAVPVVPPGSDTVVTVGGWAAAATAILNAFVPLLFAASVTCTVNDTVPVVVGVPEITPVDAAKLKPAGSDPALTLQLYGAVPPLACSVVEYAVPVVPPGSDTVMTAGDCAAAATSILRFAEAVAVGEPESFTCTVKAEVPACVGVPEI